MFRTIRRIARIAAVAAGAVGFTVVSLIPNAQPAWAPQMVALELEALRTSGWEPCEPVISQLPAELVEQGVAADADNGIQSGTCEIRFDVNIPAEDLNWVAWHEACHLATVEDIHADPAHESFDDWAHEHPLFQACIAQGPASRGGY